MFFYKYTVTSYSGSLTGHKTVVSLRVMEPDAQEFVYKFPATVDACNFAERAYGKDRLAYVGFRSFTNLRIAGKHKVHTGTVRDSVQGWEDAVAKIKARVSAQQAASVKG